ncbi:MAG: putative toxin-antitoxin system toxin component, PIN family [Herminiimonas sp.]|nr:putative toxin-antitoxin system toxin component, PIN family [Herminiimonas sp.]
MIPNRLVLDTNVCLDLFVFRDPRRAALAAALQDGSIEAVTCADCRNEWLAVLHYACFALDETRRAQCIAQFDAVIRCLEIEGNPQGAVLPRCSDKDDQKFLELARDSNASVLLTKDRALLKLAGKCRRAGFFAIADPQAWQSPVYALPVYDINSIESS